MQKIKNLAYLSLFSLVLFSCGEYQKVLNKGTSEDQYKMATKMYEGKNFGKALRLFEKIKPVYRGKPQMERIQFMEAQSQFNEKNYSISGYYFDRFSKNYPKSSKKEEAAFLSAYSYKLASPPFSLDPTDPNYYTAYTIGMSDNITSAFDFNNKDIKIIDTGILHGTLTIIINKKKFEITTLVPTPSVCVANIFPPGISTIPA